MGCGFLKTLCTGTFEDIGKEIDPVEGIPPAFIVDVTLDEKFGKVPPNGSW